MESQKFFREYLDIHNTRMNNLKLFNYFKREFKDCRLPSPSGPFSKKVSLQKTVFQWKEWNGAMAQAMVQNEGLFHSSLHSFFARVAACSLTILLKYYEIFMTLWKFYHEIFILEQNSRNHKSFCHKSLELYDSLIASSHG